ncbi:MAG: hypothetical protein JNG84_11460 [Archangium sp.]|nr:hypothetical protein [Archangium sp.]
MFIAPRVAPVAPLQRVVLIDAGPDVEGRLLRPLREAGCLPLQASTVSEALPRLTDELPDLVLVSAEGISAAAHGELEALMRHAVLRRIPVAVVATQLTPRAVFERCATLGLDDCLLEPVRLAHVKARLAPTVDSAPVPHRLRCRTVLLAGEPGAPMRVVQRVLELSGFITVPVSAETEAMAALQAVPCDAVVLCAPVDVAKLEATWGRLRSATHLPLIPFTLHPERRFPLDVEPSRLLQRLTHALGYPLVDLCVEDVVAASYAVEVRDTRAGEPRHTGLSFALTPNAIFVRSLVSARPGATVQLTVHVGPREPPLEGGGVVCWARSGTFGVQFLGLVPEAQRRLRAWCNAAPFPAVHSGATHAHR